MSNEKPDDPAQAVFRKHIGLSPPDRALDGSAYYNMRAGMKAAYADAARAIAFYRETDTPAESFVRHESANKIRARAREVLGHE